MDNWKVFEDGLLRAMDALVEESKDNMTKMLAKFHKSTILKPYKETYYQELAQVKVHNENVEKAVDFYFFDVCESFRAHHNQTDEDKNSEIKAAKRELSSIKQIIQNV